MIHVNILLTSHLTLISTEVQKVPVRVLICEGPSGKVVPMDWCFRDLLYNFFLWFVFTAHDYLTAVFRI